MSDLIIYLLKANIALALSYIGYRFLLRNLTFYKLNRYYLLFAFIFSSTYPLINWTDLFKDKTEIPIEALSIIPDWQQFQLADEGFKWNQMVEIFFWLSVIAFVLMFLIKLSGILRIHLKSVPSQWTIYPYRKSKEDIIPFSFWKNIYLNPTKHKEVELDKIFKHEYVHVCQLHSFDILIAETALVFFWYNPFCWLLRKDMRENIEFITDQKVLSFGVDKQSYQYSLLNINSLPNHAVLGNHFNFKNLKKRIWMMNKKRTSNMHLSKYVFIIPAVIIGSLVFGITKATENKNISDVIAENLTVNPTDKVSNENLISTKKDMKKIATVITKQDTGVKKKSEIVRVSTIKPDRKLSPLIDTLDNGALDITKLGDWGRKGARIAYTSTRKDSTKGEPLYIVDGKTMPNLLKIKSDNIESISILKDEAATALYGPEGKNGVILITMKTKALSEETTGSNTNKSDTVKSKAKRIRVQGLNSDSINIVGYKNSKINDTVLILLDGKKISKETFDKIDTNSIESVNVLKDEKSIERYGAKGKEGVILVSTKKE